MANNLNYNIYKIRLKHYDNNIRKLGLKVHDKMKKYNISGVQISQKSGVPVKSVRHFVNGQIAPNIVMVSTVIQTVEKIIKEILHKEDLQKDVTSQLPPPLMLRI